MLANSKIFREKLQNLVNFKTLNKILYSQAEDFNELKLIKIKV